MTPIIFLRRTIFPQFCYLSLLKARPKSPRRNPWPSEAFETNSLFCTVLVSMSTPRGESTKRRKTAREDEDYVPEGRSPTVKKAKSSKPKASPYSLLVTPYNSRFHDPTIARLGTPTQGTIRNLLLTQVALSTDIITWLHVRCVSISNFCLPCSAPNTPNPIFCYLKSLTTRYVWKY